MKKIIFLSLFVTVLFNQNYSLYFDGNDDFISLDTSIEINDIDGFSIMAKVLPQSASTDHFKVIFDVSDWEGNNDNSGADRITLSMSEDMNWCLGGHGDDNLSQSFSVCTNQNVQLNQWAEILVTVDFSSSNLRIYIDGELAGESSTNIQNIFINETSNSSSKRIGQRIFAESNTGSNFHGLIDYIAFFKEVIDISNISSSTIIDNNPYLNYSFEQSSGDVAYDLANGMNGMIHGAEWVENQEEAIYCCGVCDINYKSECSECGGTEDCSSMIYECGNYSGNLYVADDGSGEYTDNVGCEYDPLRNIQQAIDMSADGDSVFVSAGTYYENLVINKFVHLVGENRDNVIIDGGQNGRVLEINSNQIGNIENLTIQNGFLDNSDGKSGAGLYIQGSSDSYNLNNLNIINNIAKDEGGGAIFRGGRPNIFNCNISTNQSARGGGLFFTEGSLPVIDNCIISNNNIVEWFHSNNVPFVGNGAGIAIVYSDYAFNDGEYAQIQNSEFFGNNASRGGALYTKDSFIAIENTSITNNTSLVGGAIVAANSQLDIFNSVISNNTANECSGGIYTKDNSNINISNLLLVDNTSLEQHNDGGGCHSAAYFTDTDGIIDKVTVANNGGQNSIEDFGFYDSSIDVSNSIILEDIFNHNSNLVITYSNVSDGFDAWDGIGNIDIDSQLNDNYTLRLNSPCIDAGDPNSELDPDGTRADIGAYYFHQEYGCVDSFACNTSEDANIDDGSCEYSCYPLNYVLSLDSQNEDPVRIETSQLIEHASDDDFTYEIMFNTSALNEQQGIIEKGYSYVDNGWVIDVRGHNNTIAFKNNITSPIYGSETLLDNTWYHVALTKQGSTFTLYLNGDVVGSVDSNGIQLGNNEFDLTFGKGNTGDGSG